MKRAFSLVELMIVVALLGILAAIVVPTFQGHVVRSRESAAKDNLRILRNAIEVYAAQHDDVPPGYISNNPTSTPTGLTTKFQLENGYLSDIPENSFNGLNTIFAISNDTPFPTSPDNSTGWLYKPSTREIRLNLAGTDSEGISYFSY